MKFAEGLNMDWLYSCWVLVHVAGSGNLHGTEPGGICCRAPLESYSVNVQMAEVCCAPCTDL